jgi:hypothetical protein
MLHEHRRLVARERFELSSAGPEPAMFDHCTTGLRCARLKNKEFSIITLTLSPRNRDLRYFCFFLASSTQLHSCALCIHCSQHHRVCTMAFSFFRNLLVQKT